jgi:hypothetical protein
VCPMKNLVIVVLVIVTLWSLNFARTSPKHTATSVVTNAPTPSATPTAFPMVQQAPTMPSREVPQEKPQVSETVDIKQLFRKKAEEDARRMEPHLKRPFSHSGNGNTFSCEYTGKYQFDIQQTNSLVTPFTAYASFSIIWYANGTARDMQRIRIDYAYQDGQWVIKKIGRYCENGNGPIDNEREEESNWLVGLIK